MGRQRNIQQCSRFSSPDIQSAGQNVRTTHHQILLQMLTLTSSASQPAPSRSGSSTSSRETTSTISSSSPETEQILTTPSKSTGYSRTGSHGYTQESFSQTPQSLYGGMATERSMSLVAQQKRHSGVTTAFPEVLEEDEVEATIERPELEAVTTPYMTHSQFSDRKWPASNGGLW